MPNRNVEGNYRYGYQGEYAEKEPELGNGQNSFELRLWDSRIGRWLTTDPAGQYSSPYLGIGNNPISMIDPDGAKADDWYFNKETNKLEWHYGSTADIGNDNLIWVGTATAPKDYLQSMEIMFGGDGDWGFMMNYDYQSYKWSALATEVSRTTSVVSSGAVENLRNTITPLYEYRAMVPVSSYGSGTIGTFSRVSKIRNFWTGGGVNGPAHKAAKLATLGGESITVDMTWYGSIANRLDPFLANYSPWLNSKMWDGASYLFARGAQQGKVHTYFGRASMRIDDFSVWTRIEFPTLLKRGIDFVPFRGF